MGPNEIGKIDAVLLSHDQHPDGLDTAGRELLAKVPVVITTSDAAKRRGGAAQAISSL